MYMWFRGSVGAAVLSPSSLLVSRHHCFFALFLVSLVCPASDTLSPDASIELPDAFPSPLDVWRIGFVRLFRGLIRPRWLLWYCVVHCVIVTATLIYPSSPPPRISRWTSMYHIAVRFAIGQQSDGTGRRQSRIGST
ncbi:hypothetical protein OG21DRAFT_1180627 [Imleria badia]|nr:hypothetical protein OG21DRAFT_1180627 [Imleria badia]